MITNIAGQFDAYYKLHIIIKDKEFDILPITPNLLIDSDYPELTVRNLTPKPGLCTMKVSEDLINDLDEYIGPSNISASSTIQVIKDDNVIYSTSLPQFISNDLSAILLSLSVAMSYGIIDNIKLLNNKMEIHELSEYSDVSLDTLSPVIVVNYKYAHYTCLIIDTYQIALCKCLTFKDRLYVYSDKTIYAVVWNHIFGVNFPELCEVQVFMLDESDLSRYVKDMFTS